MENQSGLLDSIHSDQELMGVTFLYSLWQKIHTDGQKIPIINDTVEHMLVTKLVTVITSR